MFQLSYFSHSYLTDVLALSRHFHESEDLFPRVLRSNYVSHPPNEIPFFKGMTQCGVIPTYPCHPQYPRHPHESEDLPQHVTHSPYHHNLRLTLQKILVFTRMTSLWVTVARFKSQCLYFEKHISYGLAHINS